jgi:hypothetical protein
VRARILEIGIDLVVGLSHQIFSKNISKILEFHFFETGPGCTFTVSNNHIYEKPNHSLKRIAYGTPQPFYGWTFSSHLPQ